MRRTLTVLLLACGTLAAATDAATYRLRVDGLGCPFCAYGIEKRLSRLPGVERVEVDLQRGEVRVTTAPDATLTEQSAREAVREAGFTLREFAAGEAP